ncbi:MAG: hypothetical protein R6V33_06310 [Pelovirga sp.]
MKRNILVYEPCISNVPNIAFVLSVGQFGCTHARTAEEAINWLEAVRLKVISFDLVLVSSFSGEKLEASFLDELSAVELPVVFLQQDADSGQPAAEIKQTLCHPDDLLDVLKYQLN